MAHQAAVPAARMLTRACYELVRPVDGNWDAEVPLTKALAEEMHYRKALGNGCATSAHTHQYPFPSS